MRQFLIRLGTMVVKKSSTDHLSTGRIGQKLRTRDALVNAAAEFLAKGQAFSIAEVADRARVGRATAYRYFPTHAELFAHAALWKLTLLENKEFNSVFKSESAFELVDALVTESDKSTRAHEDEYRAILRLSLDSAQDRAKPVRSGFRRAAVKRAIGSLETQLGKEAFERVVAALCLTIGIEAAVVFRDVCLLSPNRGREIKRWAAHVILQAAVNEALTSGTKPKKISKGAPKKRSKSALQ